jgi:polysaccharide biosynthesis protein PslH
MRVLFFAPEVPFPVRHGGHVRSFGMIRCLSGFASVHVLAIGDPAQLERAELRAAFQSLGATIEAFLPTGPGRRIGLVSGRPHALWHYWSPALAQAVRAQLAQAPPDLAFFEEMVMAQYAGLLDCPAILDRQKVEWAYHRNVERFPTATAIVSPLRWLSMLRSRLEAIRFRRWEGELRPRFRTVLVLGEGDRRLLTPIHGEDVVRTVANGVDPAIRLPSARTRAVRFVLLYGSLDYPPNEEANQLYFRKVWPALRRASDLRTLVVGHGVPRRPLPTQDPRVEFRGFVDRIMSVLGEAGVLLVPLRVGGGIRNKILEALAAGMPVVSTGVGAEDLDLVEDRHYLRAESPKEMAEAALRLTQDPALVASLGQAGSRLVEERYRWEGVAGIVETLCRRVVQGGPRNAASSSDSQG